MSILEILMLALGLSMDAVAVSLSTGAAGQTGTARSSLRLSFHFGFFQAMMPVLGWLAGYGIATFVAAFDHWLAFGLLLMVGIRMIRSGLGLHRAAPDHDPTRGLHLVLLSVATSIDAFAVGFSLAVLSVPILFPAIIIGSVTFLFSLAATRLGNRLGIIFGKRMEIFGGILLILIGLRILLAHLLGI